MAAFQFPDPTVQQTVLNPITGSTYQWKEPPGKWVVTVSLREVSDIIWEGDLPPNPVGDYKLWYSTDTLELYFYYCDSNGACAWVPTSVPIQVLEDLNAFAAQAEVDIDQLQYKQQLLQNAVDQIYLDLMTGASARPPIFSDTEPTVHPDFTAPNNALETGDTWFDNTDPDQLIEYVYDGTQWIVTGNYVKKKGGDTMEGQLIINGPRKAGDDVDNPDLVSSLKVLNIDNAQNSSLQLRHSGNAKVYIGDTDVAIASDIKFNRSAPSVVKTNVQELLVISDQEIAYLGRSIEDEDLINKKYVDDIESTLQNGIIELAEEIDAIAPSVERGKWRFTAVGTVANPGQFTMYDADFGSGQPTGLFKSAKSIWFNAVDSEGVTHAFGDVDDGELLEIFVEGSPEYGLYEVVGQAHDETQGATSFWVIDVNFVRTLEDTSAVAPGETCRFKIFMAPTGGDVSSFVMKSGDTMTGTLQMGEVTSSTPNSTSSTKIKFEGKKADGNTGSADLYYLSSNYLYTNNNFYASGTVQSNSNGVFGYNGDTRMGFGSKTVDNVSSTKYGYLGIGTGSTVRALEWSGSKGLQYLKSNGTAGSQGQVLKKTRPTGSGNESRPQWQGVVDISPSGSNRCVGELWYNANDQVLYVRVS